MGLDIWVKNIVENLEPGFEYEVYLVVKVSVLELGKLLVVREMLHKIGVSV